ncbi:MAG: hypothetical protein ACHQFW_05670 [Chitinophagales bacterium]
MRTIRSIILILTCLFFSGNIYSQTVSEEQIAKIKKIYTDAGFTFQTIYMPDFNRAHPNEMWRTVPCYMGKMTLLIAAMSFVPDSLKFKASYKDIVLETYRERNDWSDEKGTLITESRYTNFTDDGSGSHENCIDVYLYDNDYIDRPVYLLIFTYPL